MKIMNYHSWIATLKGVFNKEFKEARKEFLEDRPFYYQTIDGLYKEGLLDDAHKRQAELVEKEKRFGVGHDYSLYDKVGIVKIDLRNLKVVK